MAVERTEYKFPDEVEAEAPAEQQAEAVSEADDSIEVKIEDDTPEEDRGRKPLSKRTVEEIENEDLDEYSEKVKKRLSQMKRIYHDERREKERALREREEALRFAQAREQEVQKLRERINIDQKALRDQAALTIAAEVKTIKNKLKQAYESGDSDQITDAQEALTDAKLKLTRMDLLKPSLQQAEERVEPTQQVQAPQPVAQPKADPKAEAWREKNTWFGEDEEMTALALGLHEKLVRSGVDPNSDEYYRRVDDTMRKRFPEAFEEDAEEDEKPQTRQAQKPARPSKPATVVAPVTRNTAPRQVRLSPTQVAIAKKLGLSNQEYARAMIELENNNG